MNAISNLFSERDGSYLSGRLMYKASKRNTEGDVHWCTTECGNFIEVKYLVD